MKILLFSGSLRTASLNKKLMLNIKDLLSELDAEPRIADLKALALPVYDGDIEAAGMPEGVLNLGKMISEADALIISSPEYNGSIASPLKNTLDWVSRLRPNPIEKKPVLLTGASPGGFGSIRALNHTRVPMDALGTYCYPQSFALPKAAEAFDSEGLLKSDETKARLKNLLADFKTFSTRFMN